MASMAAAVYQCSCRNMHIVEPPHCAPVKVLADITAGYSREALLRCDAGRAHVLRAALSDGEVALGRQTVVQEGMYVSESAV